MREVNRLRVFDNRVLGKVEDDVTREGRRLHNEELYDLYRLVRIIRVIESVRKWEGHVACMVERRGAYRVLVGKHEGRSSLGIPRHRWEDNISMGFLKVG